jgi:plasmid maintenance system antidote protein VapI
MQRNPEIRDFRLYLQSELARRCEKNPSYSLRSFARSLKIHHTALSRILRGKRGISKKVFRTISESLGLGPNESRVFDVAQSDDIKNLSIDTFMLISEWYHDAILELSLTKDFRTEPKWIAKRLGVTVSEINAAIQRLIRLELIEIADDGSWINHASKTEIGLDSPFTNTALKRYQRKVLEQGIEALENISKEKRHNVSSTVAINVSDLEEVKKTINTFRRKLSKFIQRDLSKTSEVYQLGICFYPVSKRKEGEIL